MRRKGAFALFVTYFDLTRSFHGADYSSTDVRVKAAHDPAGVVVAVALHTDPEKDQRNGDKQNFGKGMTKHQGTLKIIAHESQFQPSATTQNSLRFSSKGTVSTPTSPIATVTMQDQTRRYAQRRGTSLARAH